MAEESRNGVVHAEIQNGVSAIDETDAVDSDEKMLAKQIYDVVMRSVENNKDDDYVFVENLQENPQKFSSNGDHHTQQLQNGVEEKVESCSCNNGDHHTQQLQNGVEEKVESCCCNNGDMEKIQSCLENGVETGDSASNFSIMKEIGDDVSVLKQNVRDFPLLKENVDDFPVLKENGADFYLQKKNGDDSAVSKLKWGDMCDSEEDGDDSSENEDDLPVLRENGNCVFVLRENGGDFSVLKENGDELSISVEKIEEIVDNLSKSAEKVGESGDNLTNSEENVEQDEEIGDNLTNSEENVEEVEEIGDNLSNSVEEVRESKKIENNLTNSEENVEKVEEIGDNLSNSVEEVRESEKIEYNLSNSVEKVTEPEENGDVSHVIDSREENSYLGAEVPGKDEEKVDYFAKDEKACDSSENKEEDDSVDSDGVKSVENDSEEASNADQHTEGKPEEKNIDDYEEEKLEEKISNISAEVDKKLDEEEKKSEISIEAEKNTPLDVTEKTQSEEEQGSDVSAEGQNPGASAEGGKSSDASAEGGQSSDSSAEGRRDSDVSAEEGDDCDISAEEGQSSDASAEGGQSSNVSGGGGRISVVSAEEEQKSVSCTEEEQKSDISIEAHLEDQAFGVTDNTDEGRNSPQIISEAQSEISNDFDSENGGSLVEEEQCHQFASVKANSDTSDVKQDEVKNRQSSVNKRCLQNGKMGTNKRLSANASSFVMPNKGHVGRDFVPHELASIRFGSYNGFAGKGILQPPSASVAPPLQNGKPLYIVRVPKFNDPKLRLEIDAADKICKEKKLSQNKIRERMETQRKEKNNLYRTLKKAKDLVREKIEEMDSLQKSLNNMEKLSTVEDFDRKIHQLNHRIEHETMPLTEEKRLIVEIKKLRILKEKLSKDAASEVNDEEISEVKVHIDRQLQDLRQQLVALKRDVAYEENIVKSIERELQEMRMTMDDLRNQNNLAKNECDKAYDLLRRLMGKNSDLDKEARDGLNQRLRAKNHARQGDWHLAADLCNRQVEQIVQRWNADTDFRREYIKNNEKSTLDRFSTLDGRCLGPDEEPMVPSYYVGIELEAAEQEKHSAAVNTAMRENGVAESEVKAADIGRHPEGAQRIKEHDGETSTDQTNEHQHRNGRGGSSRRRPANRGKKSKKEPLPVFELEPFELTPNDKTKEVDAAEKEKEIAKRKELIRQEEIRKAKEAEERKRKQAEKKRTKELAKAQKEAEKKEKERQRRANRKEDTASSVGSKDDSQAMISSPAASGVTESNASVQKQTASQRKKTATQKTKTKTVFPGAKRNKKMWQKYLGIFAGVMCCLAFIWLLFLI